MKILFLLTQDLESPSGVGRYFPLARELAGMGHQVTIAALHADFGRLTERTFGRDGVQVRYVAQMHVLKQGDRKTYFSPPRLAWIGLRATWALTRAALSTPADIIHIGKPHPMNSLAGLAAGFLRRRVVFLDCDDHETSSNRYSGGWQRQLVAFFEGFTPRRVDQVTTHNQFMQDFLRGLGLAERRITYLPNGVDRKRFPAVNPGRVSELRHLLGLEGRQVVGFIGSLSVPAHAVYLLLEAFERVRAAEPAAALLIVGGGEEFDRLKAETERMGLARAVRFTGRIAADEVGVYYRAADVIVDPVYDEESARGRLPLKLFESWICGVPFVSGDVGDRRRVLGEPPAGILVKGGEPAELAEAVLSVLGDSDLAGELRRRGLERSELYDWSRLAQDLEQVYRQFVPKSTEPAEER